MGESFAPRVVVLVGLDMGSPVLGLLGAPPSGLSGFVGELGEVSFTGGFSTPGALFGGKRSVRVNFPLKTGHEGFTGGFGGFLGIVGGVESVGPNAATPCHFFGVVGECAVD